MALKTDLNADLGESYGRWTLGSDEALMPHLSSANIACGFHGGDPGVMRATVRLALEHGVGLGAHVGLPDLLGFGRRLLAVSPDELADYVLYQAGALQAFATAEGGALQHVKPHGALYGMCTGDAELAQAVASAVAQLRGDVILLLAGEKVETAAHRARVPFVREGYVDLDYSADGALVLEKFKKLRDPDEMAARSVRLITEGKVPTIDGPDIDLAVSSICIHGDAPNAAAIASAVRQGLHAAGVEVVPLAALANDGP
ncbi:MAG: LamB/YcsF family protein [Gaiellales bacterium]